MRPIHITMAAIAGLSLAAPASAQWGHQGTYSQQLRVQIDAGISHGTISRRESVSLREDLGRLVRLERRFIPSGINGREHAQLMQRSAALSQDIRVASRDHNRRDNHVQTWESGSVNGRWVPDARFAGLHPGDRFSGDARVSASTLARSICPPNIAASMSTTRVCTTVTTTAGSIRSTASRR